jgi:hypothetical protein
LVAVVLLSMPTTRSMGVSKSASSSAFALIAAFSSGLWYWPARSLPSSTGITLFEISAQAGMSGSEPMASLIVHSIAGKCRVVPGPTLAAASTRGSLNAESRIGEAPPPSVLTRAITSLLHTHCLKIQDASWILE